MIGLVCDRAVSWSLSGSHVTVAYLAAMSDKVESSEHYTACRITAIVIQLHFDVLAACSLRGSCTPCLDSPTTFGRTTSVRRFRWSRDAMESQILLEINVSGLNRPYFDHISRTPPRKVKVADQRREYSLLAS